MLTTSELFDLVKAKKVATRLGRKGGHYYETQQGKRVYVGHADPGMSQQLAHILKLTPHSGTTQAPVGPVEVQVLGAKDQRKLALATIRRQRSKESPRLVPHITAPKGLLARQAAKTHLQTQAEHWPAFMCRNCGTSVVPAFPTKEVGDRLLVQVTKPGGKSETLEGYDPEAAAKKLCPECSKPAEIVGGKIELRDPESKLHLTREERAAVRVASKAKINEERERQKKLEVARTKAPGKRTPEEQKLIDAYLAGEAVRGRIAKEKQATEQRQTYRKVYQDAVLAAEENEALDVARQRFNDHLISQGVTPDEAKQRSDQATVQELATFAHQMVRKEADRAEATRQKLGKVAQGKRIQAVVTLQELEAHAARRKLGLRGGEGLAIFREVLHPALAQQEEEARTARLRERKAALEADKSKVKKGLWIRI